MAEVLNSTANLFVRMYTDFQTVFPESLRILPPLILFTFLIALYAIFVWVFYRFVAQRDLIRLNLKQYNILKHSFGVKVLAIILYIVEFIFVLPFVVFFWFAVFSMLMIILAKAHNLQTILILSASIVTAIRITSYYKEDLARDLAKMVPLTFLGVALLTPGFFDVADTFSKLSQIPVLFQSLVYYAVFIISIEILLRLLFLSVKFKISEEEK